MGKTKREIKEAVVRALEPLKGQLKLPLSLEAVIKEHSNIKLIPFSVQMKRYNLNYEDMITFAGTNHAYTDFDSAHDRYIIFYNDMDADIMSSNRYRWNIAHELGHIFLEHHKENEDTRLFSGRLSSHKYNLLEKEAETFAQYILVPHSVIDVLSSRKRNVDIKTLCLISNQATDRRKRDYAIWRKRNIYEPYDFIMLNLYASVVISYILSESNRFSAWLLERYCCSTCHCKLSAETNNCPVCGTYKNPIFKEINFIMRYSGIETDSSGRALVCPVCKNEDLPLIGDFCCICGNNITNYCEGRCKNVRLPGNYRHCPDCGDYSHYFNNDWISSWNNGFAELADDTSGDVPF